MRQYRILYIDPSGLLYGSEKVLLDLLSNLDRSLFEVIIACPIREPLWEELTNRGEHIIALKKPDSTSIFRKGSFIVALRRIIDRINPDLIHLNQAGIFKYLSLATLGTKIPLVAHVRLAEDAQHILSNKEFVFQPDAYIAISEYINDLLGATLPSHKLYDPFDADLWRAQVQNNVNIRECFKLSHRTPVALFVGRICHNKGLDILIEAANMLKRHNDLHFLIVGDPPPGEKHTHYKTTLQARIAELGLEDRFTFTGFRTDVATIMSQCDLLITPSRVEPLGRVLLEALSLSLPIIASQTGGMREIVGTNQRGLSFPVGDSQKLADLIVASIKSPELTKERTVLGRKWVDQNCAPLIHASLVSDLYLKLIKNPKART